MLEPLRVFYTILFWVVSICLNVNKRLFFQRFFFMLIAGIIPGCSIYLLAKSVNYFSKLKVSPLEFTDSDILFLVLTIMALMITWYLGALNGAYTWAIRGRHERELDVTINLMVVAATSKLDAEDFDNPEIADLQDKAYSNYGSVSSFLDNFSGSLTALIACVVGGLILLTHDPLIAILVALLSGLYLFVAIKWGTKSRDLENIQADPNRRAGSIESLLIKRNQVLEFRVLGAIPNLFKRLTSIKWKLNNELTQNDYSILPMYRLAGLFGIVIAGITFYRGFFRVILGDELTEVGYIILVMVCMEEFLSSTEYLGSSLGLLWKDALLGTQVKEFIDYPDKKIKNHRGKFEVDRQEFISLILEEVSFSYPNSEDVVLDRVNLEIMPGEKVALVGSNGSGKSTLISLLQGHYEPTFGRVILNDKDASYQNPFISNMPQDYASINLSIRELLKMGSSHRDVSDEELWSALRLSTANSVVSKMPNGIDSFLGREFLQNPEIDFATRGVEPSDGQYQRLRIAMALVERRGLIMMDESTSMVDSEESEKILSNLLCCDESTLVFVSHRFDNVRRFPRIIVLEEGRIIGDGDHDYLIETCSSYRNMFDAQAQYFN